MLAAYYDPRGRRIRALRDGPSGALFEAFAHALFQTGYPASTARTHLGAAEHFLRWTTQRRWSVAELSERSLTRFDHHLVRCRCRYRHANRTNVLYGARLFLQALREAGIIAMPAMPEAVPDSGLLRAFCRWMREQRGTCETTLSNYGRHIRALLGRLGEEPSQFDARSLRSVVLEKHRASGWAAAKTCTTALPLSANMRETLHPPEILRTRINRIIENVDDLMQLPGATVMRVGDSRISLPEIRANLEDILRFQLQPLMGLVSASGLLRDAGFTTRYFENQLSGVRRAKVEAEGRAKTLQESLQVYMMARGAVSPGGGQERGVNESASSPAPGASGLIPQIGESFLDRLVAMATDSVDREYRQKLTDRIILAGQAKVALEREEAHYQEVLRAMASAGRAGADGRVTVETVNARFEAVHSGVVRALEQMNQSYAEISARNLNPRTSLYSVTGPFIVSTLRGLTLRTLALYGLLTMMTTLAVVTLACLVHHYFRREILPQRATIRAPAPRPPAEQEDNPVEHAVQV